MVQVPDPDMRKQLPTPVSFLGSTVPWGGSIIHFYYSPEEQVRSAAFLAEAVAEKQAAILACTFDGYVAMAEQLRQMGIATMEHKITRLELTAKLTNSIYGISAVARQAASEGRPVRLLLDFGAIVPQENIFDAEAAVSAMLEGLDAVCLTQYDGRAFPAPVTIEQFRTHALAVVGNVLHHENRTYTRPEKYFRYRTASGGG